MQRVFTSSSRRLACHHNNRSTHADSVLAMLLTGTWSVEAGTACNPVPFNPISLLHTRVHTTNAALQFSSCHDQTENYSSTAPPPPTSTTTTELTFQDLHQQIAKPIAQVQPITAYLHWLKANRPDLQEPAPAPTLLQRGQEAADAWRAVPTPVKDTLLATMQRDVTRRAEVQHMRETRAVAKQQDVVVPRKIKTKEVKDRKGLNSWTMFVKTQVGLASASGNKRPSMGELSKQWKGMTKEEKKGFEDMAVKENAARQQQ